MSTRKRLIAGALLAASLAFCLLGQYYFSNLPDYRLDAAILYAMGALLFVNVLVRLGTPAPPAPSPAQSPHEPLTWRWLLVSVSVGLGIVAYIALAKNTFTRFGVMCWAGSGLFFMAATWPRIRFSLPALRFTHWKHGVTLHLKWRTLALLAIFVLATFFRLYRLDQVPPEMTSDHVEKLLDIYDMARGARPIYFERNTGREPFQFYWAFSVMRLFNTGITFYGLKLANALIGIVTICGIYLLGRELAGPDVGLLAAFFASVMQWAQSITRMGLRFPYVTIASTFALWALLRALRTGRRADYLVAGLIFGAGFHGYTAYRIMPAVCAVWLAIKLFTQPPRSRAAWGQLVLNLIAFGGMVLIVFLPLARYWHDQPDMFWYRSATRVQGEYDVTAQNVWQTLGHNTLRALGMFNVVGDTVWANTVPDKPALDEVSGAFFVLGLLAALYALLKPNQAEGEQASKPRDLSLFMAIVAGVILLFPSILSLAFPNENPSVVRTAGAIPIAAVLAGLGLYTAARSLRQVGGPRLGALLSGSLVALALITTTLANYQRYFVFYLHSYQLSAQNSSEIAAALQGFIATGGDLKHAVIRAWPYWVDTRAVALIMGDPGWQDTNVVIERVQDLARLRHDPAQQMYALHPEDITGLITLKDTFPEGYAVRHHSPVPGHDFMLFLVPMRALPAPEYEPAPDMP